MAVQMRIDAHGQKLCHRFVRGLMRSQGSLHYGQVQDAIDGRADTATALLLPVLTTLYAAYAALGYFSYIFYYWIYFYFGEIRHMGYEQSARFTTLVFIVNGFAFQSRNIAVG